MGQTSRRAMEEHRAMLDAQANELWNNGIEALRQRLDANFWRHRGRMSTKGALGYPVAWLIGDQRVTVGVRRRLLRMALEHIRDPR